GDPVCALLSGGGYAERVAVPVGQLLPVPEGVDLVDAAALPEVACTVWSNLVMVGGLRSEETVLVHGGGSGIGTFAIQFACALGARVAVTAGSEEKLRSCRDLGAHITINYRTEDFTERMRAEGGADLILDIMGGAYLDGNLRSLNTGGRITTIALMGGRRAELDLGRMLAKRLSVHATTLRSRPVDEKTTIVAGVREHVWPLVEQGAVLPVIDRSLPLREAAEAHRVMEASAHIGKILLTRGDDFDEIEEPDEQRREAKGAGPRVDDGIRGAGGKHRQRGERGVSWTLRHGGAAREGDADRQHDPSAPRGGEGRSPGRGQPCPSQGGPHFLDQRAGGWSGPRTHRGAGAF